MKFSMWISGWCAAIAVVDLINGYIVFFFILLIISITNLLFGLRK
jgi:hypothetical protein